MNSIRVALNDLFLDPNNFRLRSNPNYHEVVDATPAKIMNGAVQERTKRLLIGEKATEVKDIMDSLRSNGFLKVDNILVKKLNETGKYVVIEGNRRVAALKLLEESYKNGYDIGKLDALIFQQPEVDNNAGVEVVEYSYVKEEDYLILMALRHVSGNKKWDRYNQAKLIAELHEKDYTIEEITNRIGLSSKTAVQQQLDAYYAISDYLTKKSLFEDEPDFNPHEKFMIFLETLLKRNVREWLGWDGHMKKFNNESNLSRFYQWVSPYTKLDFDDEDNDGEEIEKLPPIIVNHKQIRLLDQIVNDEESLIMMEEKRDINEALEQNSGFTQKKFLIELKKAERTLRNIKFGATLKIDVEETDILNNIITLSQKIARV